MPVLRIEKQYFDATETALIAREMGLKNVSERTVREAAYYGDRPESMEVAIAAQKIEAWLEDARGCAR